MMGLRDVWNSVERLSKLIEWANWGIAATLLVAFACTVIAIKASGRKDELTAADDLEKAKTIADTSERAGRLEKEAAELIKAAEDERLARVELESKVAWRKLAPKEQEEIVSHLIRFAKEPALISYNPNDVEASAFASDIAKTLHAAKWDVSEPLGVLSLREGPVPIGTNPHLSTGVFVWHTDDDGSRQAANALVEQLSLHGFDAILSAETRTLLAIHPTPTRVVMSIEHKPEAAQGEYKLTAQKTAKK